MNVGYTPGVGAVHGIGGCALVLLAVATFGWLPIGSSDATATWLASVALAAAAVVCAARARRAVGGERLAWAIIAAAPACWIAGELVWEFATSDDVALHLSDALWLTSDLVAAIGVSALVRTRRLPGTGRVIALDVAVGVTAVTALAIAVWLGPVLDDTQSSSLERAISVAFPVADLVLLALAVTIVALAGGRLGRAWVAVVLALAVQALADAWSAHAIVVGAPTPPAILPLAWPAAWLLVSAAAWTPLPDLRSSPVGSARSAVLPVTCALVALGVLVAAQATDVHPVALVLATAALAASIARLAGVLIVNGRLVQRLHQETRTDALTGLPNRRALIADLGAAAAEHRPCTLALFDLDGFKAYNDRFGHLSGDALLTRLAGELQASSPSGRAYRLGGDEFCVLAETHNAEALRTAATEALCEVGEGFAVSASGGHVLLPDEASDVASALTLADRRMYANKARRPTSAPQQSRAVLLTALASREPDVGKHSEGVGDLARRVAERLRQPVDVCDDIGRADDLHDVGKVAIPDAILNKPGPLTPEERLFMQRHTVIGEEIVAAAPALAFVAQLVRAHHERWDGAGYPDRLSGDQIPLGARIIAVCDAYCAMVQDRPYQAARSPQAAVAELQAAAGAQFDPSVVSAFLAEVGSLERERERVG